MLGQSHPVMDANYQIHKGPAKSIFRAMTIGGRT